MVVMYKTAHLVLYLSVLFTYVANAQQKNYSLSDFVDSAEHHMPVLLQKKALIDAAKAGVKDARHSFLPELL